jgi:choice-of-anchor C domain-containing protein
MRFRLLLAVAVVCTLTTAARAAYIVNGSFEEGPEYVDGWYIVKDGDSTTIPGWTVKTPLPGRDIDIVTTYWEQTDGERSLDLSGLWGPGGIAQTFATTPGNSYDVSFMMAGNSGTWDPRQSHLVFDMNVTAAGQTGNFSFDVFDHSYREMGWEQRSWSFVADSTSTELWFYQVGDPYPTAGPALDKVEVFGRGVAVPAPSSLATLVGVGVMVVGMEWWKKRRRRSFPRRRRSFREFWQTETR